MAEHSRIRPLTVESVSPAHVLVAEARYYENYSDFLLRGATAALEEAGASYDVVTVPGTLELPAAVAICLDAEGAPARRYDAVVALGCVIRGETYHFEIVSNESARALMDLAVARKLPLGNGVLTIENDEQALVRAHPERGDKGGDAARAALALLRLRRKVGA